MATPTALLSTTEICERALRRCGTFSVHDQGADADALVVARECLDMILGELSGTMRAFWLIEDQIDVPLAAGVSPTHLATAADPAIGDFQFLYQIALVDTETSRAYPLRRLLRSDWAAIPDQAQAGFPSAIFVDRRHELDPLAYTYPVQQVDTLALRTTYQRFAPKVLDGTIDPDVPRAWQRYLVFQLAADIGSGPVTRRPIQETKDDRDEAALARARLEAFQNRQHAGIRHTRFRDF
jgi:hypothetical protein